MSKKIGRLLVERGLINQAKLETALQAQLMRGGTLGTCLLEAGFIDEATFGRVLADATGLPYAPAQMFQDIPAAVLQTVPAELAGRNRVVPIGLEDKELHVAVISPNGVAGLSNRTGCKIIRHVAPERRILQAMEKYYAIPIRRRFFPPAKPTTRNRPRTAAARDPEQADAVPAEVAPSPELTQLAARMSRVSSHGELGEVLLDHGVRRMERCILFSVGENGANVANWKGVDLDSQHVQSLNLPLTPRSIFGLILEESFYRGEIPTDHATFYRELRLESPREAQILPIYGEEKLDAVLYGDAGAGGRIEGPIDDCLLLLSKINLAMKMLSLKTQLSPS